MRTTLVEAALHPYSDGSGHREEIAVKWQRDDDRDIVAQVEIKQGSDNRLVILIDEWPAVRDAVDQAIIDSKYKPRT